MSKLANVSDEPKCPACGKPWKEHRGCIAMCAEIERLTAALAEAQAVIAKVAALPVLTISSALRATGDRSTAIDWEKVAKAAEAASGEEEQT